MPRCACCTWDTTISEARTTGGAIVCSTCYASSRCRPTTPDSCRLKRVVQCERCGQGCEVPRIQRDRWRCGCCGAMPEFKVPSGFEPFEAARIRGEMVPHMERSGERGFRCTLSGTFIGAQTLRAWRDAFLLRERREYGLDVNYQAFARGVMGTWAVQEQEMATARSPQRRDVAKGPAYDIEDYRQVIDRSIERDFAWPTFNREDMVDSAAYAYKAYAYKAFVGKDPRQAKAAVSAVRAMLTCAEWAVKYRHRRLALFYSEGRPRGYVDSPLSYTSFSFTTADAEKMQATPIDREFLAQWAKDQIAWRRIMGHRGLVHLGSFGKALAWMKDDATVQRGQLLELR